MVIAVIVIGVILIVGIIFRIIHGYNRIKVGKTIKYRDGKYIFEGKVEYVGHGRISVNNKYIEKSKVIGIVPKIK